MSTKSERKKRMQTVTLLDAVAQSKLHPDTFHIPDNAERNRVQPGDHVRLTFLSPGLNDERMWVLVTKVTAPGEYIGRLDSNPVAVPMKSGQRVVFGANNILDIDDHEVEKMFTQAGRVIASLNKTGNGWVADEVIQKIEVDEEFLAANEALADSFENSSSRYELLVRLADLAMLFASVLGERNTTDVLNAYHEYRQTHGSDISQDGTKTKLGTAPASAEALLHVATDA
jgi:hypothetical protein